MSYIRYFAALAYLAVVFLMYISPLSRQVSDLENRINDIQKEIEELKSAVYIAPDGKETKK